MRFLDTILMEDLLVKNAFDYAQAYTQALAAEVLHGYKEDIDANYKDDLDFLEETFDDGEITRTEYEQKKTELKKQRAAELKEIATDNIPDELQLKLHNIVGAATEIQEHSGKATPALIAAALLAECARDPVDCKKIEEKFGPAIGSMIAEILHIEAYPATRAENAAAADPDTKRLYMAEIINSFHQMYEMPPEEAEAAFTEAKSVWGNDKKLDKRLISIFNKTANDLVSSYRMEISAKGRLELVHSPIIPSRKIIPGKKRKGCGDDGF